MGCGDTPALTAPFTTRTSEAADGSGTTYVDNSSGADHTSFPSMSLEYNPFPCHDIEGFCQSCPFECDNENSKLGDYMNPICPADSETDVNNLFGIKNDALELHKESKTPNREGSAREISREIDENNHATANCLSKTAISSTGYRKSDFQMKSMPVGGEIAAGYPMKEHGAEAKAISIKRPQMPVNSSSGFSTSALFRAGDFGQQGVENELDFVPVKFGAPGKVNGSFLRLGVGGGTEIRPNSNFNTREIARKLEESVPSQLNSSRVKNPLSLTQVSGRGKEIHNSASGLQSSSHNFSGRTFASGEDRHMRDTSAWLNSAHFRSLPTPQPDIQNNSMAKSNTFQFDLTPSSLPFGTTPISYPERFNSPQLGPEPIKPTSFANQLISNQKQNFYRKSFTNVVPESSSNSLFDQHRRSSSNHAQLVNEERTGKRIFSLPGHQASLIDGTRTEVTGVNSFSTSVQPGGQLNSYHNGGSAEALGNGLFPEKVMLPVSRGDTFRSAGGGPFPRRLGVHFNDSVTPPSATGLPPTQLAAPFNPLRHLVVSPGQHYHGMPAHLSLNLPSVDYSTGQVVPKLDFKPQASSIALHQSLKRQPAGNPPTERLSQRRKIIPQPVVHNSALHQSQRTQAPLPNTFPATAHIPAAPLHIKWEGFDGPRKPTGEKCLLCKRDLSFTAEGPVYQPAIPPAVAVLSCGHTFHDHCLEIITPEDQSNDPPCIPCVIGET